MLIAASFVVLTSAVSTVITEELLSDVGRLIKLLREGNQP